MKKFVTVALFVAITLLTTATASAKSSIIPDVPEGHFAYSSTKYVVEKGILLPYADGTFRGDRYITNYEFAMGLAKILDDTYKGTIEVPSMPFSDIPASHWAYERVAKLAWAGVEEGYADGTFKGDKNATRYETAHSAGKLLAKVAPNAIKSLKLSMPYSDVPKDHWAYKSISLLNGAKVTLGYGDGTYRGDRTRTRYEAAQLLAKLHMFLNKVKG